MSDPLDFTQKDTVLIVDDAPDNLTLMTGVLRGLYKTKVANSGERGLQVASTRPFPDLVLLDIDMPGMDGYEVCRRLKADEATAAIPVIFLTAKTGVEDEQKGFDVGCVDYITKPISAPLVLARVKTHLLLKSARDFLKDSNAYLEEEVERVQVDTVRTHTKRSTWLDVLTSMADVDDPVTPGMRQALSDLDQKLFDFWHLGEKIVLAWSHGQGELRFLGIPHYEILKASHSDAMNAILAGPKCLPPAEFDTQCSALGGAAELVRLSLDVDEEVAVPLINSLVTRYGVTLVRGRAVVLLDIVGFSLRSPLEQVAMLNSLSYSVNCAYSQLTSKDIQINFARTTTGDGFYIWNRSRTHKANVALYKLMMLILADNAVAHAKAGDFPVPRLRAAFHIGEHYEFYQVEALNPTTFGYIVGPVTVELARMLGGALVGQIVIGKFNEKVGDGIEARDTIEFVESTASTLDQLGGLAVAGDRIHDIRCYLTGPSAGAGSFGVTPFAVTDKHGLSHTVYNAKINIHLQQSDPIFLGIQHKDVEWPDSSA